MKKVVLGTIATLVFASMSACAQTKVDDSNISLLPQHAFGVLRLFRCKPLPK
jgi:hypothetical protein